MARRIKHASNNKQEDRPVGTANQSQLVGIFGAGSIYEMRGWHRRKAVASSLMIAGLDNWPKHRMSRISEPALESLLGVQELLEPPSASEDATMESAIPAIRFPEWMSCSGCGRMGTVYRGHFHETSTGVAVCSANSCDGVGVPGRFIVACEGDKENKINKGHISDFPWEKWCHLNFKPDGSCEHIECESPQLFLQSIKGKTGLDGLKVQCKSCGHGNTLKAALKASHKHLFHCKGEMPWLRLSGKKQIHCECDTRVLLRGATNVYFPVSNSVISIPPWSNPLYQKMGQEKTLAGYLTAIKSGLKVDMFVPLVNKLPWATGYTPGQIKDALLQFTGSGDHQAVETFDDRLSQERHAIVAGNICKHQDGDQFLARPVTGEKLGEMTGWVENLVQVERLRVVRALSGFTRVHTSTETVAALSTAGSWLPAINVFGEGIYFELNQNKLQKLEDDFSARLRKVRARAQEKNIRKPKVTAGFMALHTLSHLLIRQLSLECGYSSASLSERLYYSEGAWAGVLIYTASSSSDGTLGGLVQQGEPSTLSRLIREAVQNAQWCSSDPLCIESEGQGSDALNLAACHACSLVAETSCSEGNSFLDRALLTGKDSVSGYFDGLFVNIL